MSTSSLSQNQWKFSPQTIPGCQLWLDAADSRTVTGTTAVTSWKDKSANNLTATYGGTAPIYTTLSGYPAIKFSGASSFTTGTMPAGSLDSTGITFFTVVTQTLATQLGGLVLATATPEKAIRFDSGYCEYTFNNSSVRGQQNDYTSGIKAFVDSAASLNVFVNGSNTYSSATAVTYQAQTTSTFFQIGIWSTSYLYGYINEIIVFNNAITTIQRQQVEGYLAQKWGLQSNLPATHPYYAATTTWLYKQPVSQRPFQPVDITGCALWLDAADPTTVTGTSSVTAWRDKSGTANNMSLTAGTVSYSSATNAVTFASGGIMTSANTTATVASQTVVFVVFQATATSSSYDYVFVCPNITPAGSSTGDYSIRLNPNVTSLLSTNTGDIGFGTAYYINGILGVASAGVITLPAGTNIVYGLFSTGGTTTFALSSLFNSRYFVGTIQEVIVYTGPLTISQRQQVEAYLGWKWGLRTNFASTHTGFILPSYSSMMTPKSISGLKLWLDAGDPTSITFSSGTTATVWLDKSGNGNNGTANTGVIWNADGLSTGRPAMTFTNTQWFLGNISITAVGTMTVFAVYSMSSSSGASARVIGLAATGANDYNSASYAAILRQTNSIGPYRASALVSSVAITYATPTLASVWFDGATGKISANGTLAPASGASTGNFTISSYAVGNNTNTADTPNGPFNGFISEILVYNVVLTTAQRQQVEGYLAWKWGLAVNLPVAHSFSKISP